MISAMAGVLSQFVQNCRPGRAYRPGNGAGENTHYNGNQNDVDSYRQFRYQGKIGSDRDSRKESAILHGENSDQLRKRFSTGNQGVGADPGLRPVRWGDSLE